MFIKLLNQRYIDLLRFLVYFAKMANRNVSKQQVAVAPKKTGEGAILSTNKLRVTFSEKKLNKLSSSDRQNLSELAAYANKIYEFSTDVKKLTEHMLPLVDSIVQTSLTFSIGFSAYQKHPGAKISKNSLEKFNSLAFAKYQTIILTRTFENYASDVKKGIVDISTIMSHIILTLNNYATFTVFNLQHVRLLKKLGLKQLDFTKLSVEDKQDFEIAAELDD